MTARFRDDAKALAHPWVDPDTLRDPARAPDPWPQLVRVAHTTLRREGPVYRLREDHERPGREILRWRCLSLALPPALWCAAAHPANVGPDPPTRIRLLGRMLAPASPVAHLHLHLSAAHAFRLVWSALAARGVPAAVDANPSPLGDTPKLQQEWRRLLIRALLVRRMLATAIECGLDLDDIVEQPQAFERRLARRRALADLRQGRIGPSDHGLESAIDAEASAPAGTTPPAPTCAADVWAADPLADGRPDPEVRFLARAFAARLSTEAREALIQYVRVYCMLYRHLVQPLDAPGFPQFREKFSNGMTYAAHLKGVMPEPRDDAPYLQIEAVEARVGPTVRTIEGWCARLREREPEARPTFSLVIHFLRRQKRESLQGSIARLHREAQSLAGWMTQNSDALTLVRGFDLAGDEIGGPLWTALPALVHMRAEADRLAALSEHPSPGLTLHVGEVGRTWLSQLRAVDAPFARRLLRRGDRLGHGMILGRDPAEARSLGGAQPLWERIVDLEWLLEWLSCPALARFQSLRAPFIAERRDLLAEWSSADAPPMGSIWRGLGDPRRMLYLAENPQHESGARAADRFISAIIDPTDQRSKRLSKGVWEEQVVAAPPVALLDALRRLLLRKIADWQIPIEVNPSSNLVIGALDAPFDQPLFQLRATSDAAFEVVPVVLSTDDPLQFSTCLEDEYAYAFAGMTAADDQQRPASYARHWLEDAAHMSLRARF